MRMLAWAFPCAFAASIVFACGDDKKVIDRCPEGSENCKCGPQFHCNAGLACSSEICVKYSVGGSSGSGPDGSSGSDGAAGDGGRGGSRAAGGEGGAGGDAGAAGQIGAGGDGGVTGQGGAAGDAGSAGQGGVSGSAGVGGSAGVAGSAGIGGIAGVAGSGGATGDTCGGAPVTTIDNFVTCNDRICELAGRSGAWYMFADTGVNLNFAVSIPGTGWIDKTCAAWAIGGPLTTGSKTFAGIGLQLAEGAAYNLTSYSGVTVALETDARVWFVVKTANGGYFGGWLAATSGTETRSLSFAALSVMTNSTVSILDRSQVTEFQFTAEFPASGFGWAVHGVTLY